MGRTGMLTVFWWKSQKERDLYEHLEAGGEIILKWMLDK
jgi:hypothetical protein